MVEAYRLDVQPQRTSVGMVGVELRGPRSMTLVYCSFTSSVTFLNHPHAIMASKHPYGGRGRGSRTARRCPK